MKAMKAKYTTAKPVSRYVCPRLNVVVTVYPTSRKGMRRYERPSSASHAKTKHLPAIKMA